MDESWRQGGWESVLGFIGCVRLYVGNVDGVPLSTTEGETIKGRMRGCIRVYKDVHIRSSIRVGVLIEYMKDVR